MSVTDYILPLALLLMSGFVSPTILFACPADVFLLTKCANLEVTQNHPIKANRLAQFSRLPPMA
ncbi:hypothetical protein IQ06DRAFT_290361 [Phaeosphaeriaceae sp. SRC1lsM3a]|nr:hypothetical protein IQ06DRAFT_290361 [Stagonospora sp. SRC1lsM3a]